MRNSKQIKIVDMEWNSDLAGFILTLNDNRKVQIQFDDRLRADYGTNYPIIDKQNCYGLAITDDEEEQIEEYILTNKTIRAKAEELDAEAEG